MNQLKKFAVFTFALFLTAFAYTGLVAPSCSTLQGVTRMDEMSDEEFSQWSNTAANQVALFAKAGIEEGDLTKEQVGQLAEKMRGVADGSYGGSIGDLVMEMDFHGYKGLALALLLQEFGEYLVKADAYVDGLLSERGRAAIDAVAYALDKVAQE
jgi:hypothetical protein